ncbi:AhpD family alkylhydroperoxidase [Kineothrix alysoides]|uniref:AhpD family alkylhydroperoxidase n=1 Tax=Kineothrix alysoides TaxID=1469948 RepID=A0A4R1QWA4_9FIRM|nr:carboxymuconolactone decarboxylase family protein [Kineothrix alysoides]TCL57561.1 AhpD family alkylhydroperoxidase [Kineothrix alysoides]
MKVSKAYQLFEQEAPAVHNAWMETVYTLEKESALDKKTKELAYLAVLAATRLDSGLPFHVKMAKSFGATREEIISSILAGLPAVGNVVIQSLPTALEAYDESL